MVKTISKPVGDKNARETEKKARFKTLAEKRVTRLLDNMDSVGKLSSRNNYAYSEEQVAVIERALTDKLTATIALFRATKEVGKKSAFSLGGE